MMASDDHTLRVLVEIRDGITKTREELSARIDETNKRVDDLATGLNKRIDETNQRIAHSEIRLATAITDLAGTLGDVRDKLIAQAGLDARVTHCEVEIAEIKKKLN